MATTDYKGKITINDTDIVNVMQQVAAETPVPISVGSVAIATLAAGSQATAQASISSNNSLSFTFGIPKGDKGDRGATGVRGSQWYSGTVMTGTSTTPTVFANSGIASALVGDYYLNSSTGYVYSCTTAGNASTAKWKFSGNIKGATGPQGQPGKDGVNPDPSLYLSKNEASTTYLSITTANSSFATKADVQSMKDDILAALRQVNAA